MHTGLHILLFLLPFLRGGDDLVLSSRGYVWCPDNGNGTYTNPIIHADYSDPDAIRVGDFFYMVSSSFNCAPGMPVLRSRDLVNWEITGHVFDRLPSARYNIPRHGEGCWAPSIRYHDGSFYVYYGDPDIGIFMSKAKHPEGPWDPLVSVREGRGWIDPCPLWDDDGQAYLVHAWANSRVGIKSILTVHRMDADGRKLLDEGTNVFDGAVHHPTIEGPKFYKRNGYYYIFAPAGGVPTGWQTVLRARNVYGPYEDRVVMDQGSTTINGPHQGAWVETCTGESWFLHFQDRGPYGRLVHLQPMTWQNDWPVIGNDPDGDGKGEPVDTWRKPHGTLPSPLIVPRTSDEFNSPRTGWQWQWHGNSRASWSSCTARTGYLRLYSITAPDSTVNLWSIPNLFLQKFPAPEFVVTTRLRFSPKAEGEAAGLVIMGIDYAALIVKKHQDGITLIQLTCERADTGSHEIEQESQRIPDEALYLRVMVDSAAKCHFSYSREGKRFVSLGMAFQARKGRWIGAKVGMYALAPVGTRVAGFLDVDWFRVEPRI
jgi:beta-xylosidase